MSSLPRSPKPPKARTGPLISLPIRLLLYFRPTNAFDDSTSSFTQLHANANVKYI
ncbi:hypothetical protein BJY00DRAFT_54649 [Aspergillus carlsbadensis]|nr:hypothetical protein BJY00DRAFT_54649 [Aspergillus carlsbadensis]